MVDQDVAQRLADLEGLVSAQAEQLARQETELARQRAELAALRATGSHFGSAGGEGVVGDERAGGSMARRDLLTGVGVLGAELVVAGAGLTGTATPAAAANGDPILIGAANSGTTVTALTTSSAALSLSSTSSTAAHVLRAERNNTATDDPTVLATTRGTGPAVAASVSYEGTGGQVQPVIKAVHEGAGGGLWAERLATNDAGLPPVYALDHGTRGAVVATSQGIAVEASGTRAPLRLVAQGTAVPTSGTHSVGEIRMGTDGNLAVCVIAGSPGRWRRLAAAVSNYDNWATGSAGWAGAVGLMRYPFRLFDSRPGTTAPFGGDAKLVPGTSVPVQVTEVSAPGSGARSGPGGAVGVICTVTVTNTEGSGGYVKAFPADADPPNTSVVNWFGPGQNLASTTMVRLDEAGRLTLRVGSNRTDVLLDVIGFVA